MRSKILYNYIVNTFGLSKEKIMEVVDQRIENLLAKHIASRLDSTYVEKLILNRVTNIMENGIPSGQHEFFKRQDFDIYLKKVLRDVVESKLQKDYEAEIKLVHKDTKLALKVSK